MSVGEPYPYDQTTLEQQGILLHMPGVEMTDEQLRDLSEYASALVGGRAVKSAAVYNMVSIEPLGKDEPPVAIGRQDTVNFVRERNYPHAESLAQSVWSSAVMTEYATRIGSRPAPPLAYIGYTPSKHQMVSKQMMALLSIFSACADAYKKPDANQKPGFMVQKKL